MKTAKFWRLSMGDMQILPGSRYRPPMKKPMWIVVLVSFVIMFLTCAYIYRLKNRTACNMFNSRGCNTIDHWFPPVPAREYTDDEIAAHVVFRDILNSPIVMPENPKIAFMFLTPGSLPFEKLWDNFFQVRICYLSFLCFINLFIDHLMHCISLCFFTYHNFV
jgi:hypothetical protein